MADVPFTEEYLLRMIKKVIAENESELDTALNEDDLTKMSRLLNYVVENRASIKELKALNKALTIRQEVHELNKPLDTDLPDYKGTKKTAIITYTCTRDMCDAMFRIEEGYIIHRNVSISCIKCGSLLISS